MKRRFYVHMSVGYLGQKDHGGAKRPPGVTFTIHDRLLLHETVALIRSEDFKHPRGTQRAVTRGVSALLALDTAHGLAHKLNRAAA